MVRLNHEPYITHLSHPHQLELRNSTIVHHHHHHHHHHQEAAAQNRTSICSGCKLESSGFMYSCRRPTCNFSLHTSCAEMPQLITHPSHPKHNLSLLPICSYPQGQFKCDACNRSGNGFSYHCSHCDFDLHILCASKPLSVVNHQFHPNHPLQLTFYVPYGTNGFSCDICKNVGAKQWLYRCSKCEFDVHLDCATATATATAALPAGPPIPQPHPQPQLHHAHSYPGMSTSTYQQQHQQQPNYVMHSASLGAQPSNQQLYANNNNWTGAVLQGFVEGAAQQVGQNYMQNVMGGDTGIGDGGDVIDGGADFSGF